MAGPVKGTIGNDEVVLNDAATETTMLELVKAVEALAKISSGDASQAREALKDLGNKSNKAGDSLDNLADSADNASEKISGWEKIGNAIGGFTEEVLVGGMRISDFTSHITGLIQEIPYIGGLLGGSIQLLVSTIDSNIDNFRELTNVGTDFGGSLFNAQLQATKAGLSLDTFTNVLTNNADALALMTGGSTSAARAFTEISGNLQREFGPRFSALGMTMEETAQFTADYLELQTRLGRSQRMDNFQLTQGTAVFIEQLDRLAKVTGKRREQVAAELKEFADDRRLKALLSALDPAVKAQIDGTLSLLKGASPDLQNIVTELIGTSGVPISDQAKALAVINPSLRSMAKGLSDGTVTQEQYAEEVRKTARRIGASSIEQARFRSQLIALGVPIAEVEAMLIGLDNVGKDLTTAQQQQLDAATRGNQGLLDFERRITQARNVILGTLIESGIFQSLEYMLNDIVDFFTGPDGIDTVREAVGVVGDFISGFVADVKALGLVETIKMYVSDAFSGLGDMIKQFIFGSDKPLDNTQKIKETETTVSKLETERLSLQENIIAGNLSGEEAEKAAGKIQQLTKQIDHLNAKKTELAKEQGQKDEGLVGAIFGDLTLLETAGLTIAGILGTGGAVYVAFKAFATVLAGFGAPQVMAGAAVVGGLVLASGAAVKLVGDGVDSVGDGLLKVADAMEQMSKIQGADNIKTITDALGDLGPALLFLIGNNVFDKIAKFFGSGSPFDSLIEGVNKFESANMQAVSNIRDVGTGLEALSGVTNDLDTTPIISYTEAIEELVEALNKLNDELAEDNEGILGGGTGVAAADLLQNVTGGGRSDKLDELNNTMMMVLQTLQQMNNTGRRQLRATEGMGNTVQ